ncbi:hypothetical protein AMK68_00655 [candidate division KD3-62 bacterium DG_56]|uniref:Uncharacterized protein n=1 Tax=candidate division KD3-62 bacterium DG_56 TaxID=1704032 RepID=A0A0S7XRR7_9BACT|nr:MAG: hypothetical protein AMK68_00655 [candidate division KD3-62 bacterium DG_56]
MRCKALGRVGCAAVLVVRSALAPEAAASAKRTTGVLLRRTLGCALIIASVLAWASVSALALPKELSEARKAFFKEMASDITIPGLARHIKELSSIDSRVTGYPGCDEAADYVYQQFEEIGLERIRRESFQVTVPVGKGSLTIHAAGSRTAPITIYPLWPNDVRTCKLPKDGLDVPLIYAGGGELREFNGKPVKDTAVLMEFTCGGRWLNAPRLGAKAVLFIEPESTVDMRGEAEAKFLAIPIDVPRFWVKRQDAQPLLALLKSTPQVTVHLECDSDWATRTGYNIIGVIPGSGRPAAVRRTKGMTQAQYRAKVKEAQDTARKLKDEVVYLTAYYDSMSIVPDLAPGAESACGIASLLETARVLKKYPPKRTVVFLATSGHFEALKGVRSYLWDWLKWDRLKVEPELASTQPPKPVFERGINHPTAASVPGLARWVAGWRVFGGSEWAKKVADYRGIPAWLGWALGAAAVLLLISACIWPVLRKPTWVMVPVAVLVILVAGVRYTRDHYVRDKIHLWVSLDLSSRRPRAGIFYKTMFYEYREDIQRDFSDLARVFRENSEKVAPALGLDAGATFVDGVNPIAGKPWRTFLPGKMAGEHEPFTVGGGRGVALITTDDMRPMVDTPFDTFEHVNVGNLQRQVRLLTCLVREATVDKDMPMPEEPVFKRMTLTAGYGDLSGVCVEFVPSESLVPKTPVPGSIASLRLIHNSLMGVRGTMMERVGSKGEFHFMGIPTVNAIGRRPIVVNAYRTDPTTGEIDYAVDQGAQGTKRFKNEVFMTMGHKEVTVVLFKCISMALYDLVDPLNLVTLTGMNIYDAETDAEPQYYGCLLARPEAWASHVEDVALVFMPRYAKVKVTMNLGPTARRFVLLKSDAKNPQGVGFPPESLRHTVVERAAGGGMVERRVSSSFVVENTPLQVANDLWHLDEMRINKLAKFRIINDNLNQLHEDARQNINQARAALKRMDYAAMNSHARAAWGYEARAYPDVQRTTDDVLKGVLFYLALMLPFAVFCERLFFAFPDLRVQIMGTFAIFGATVAVFRWLHPAFDISMNPIIVILSFVMLALAVLVIGLVTTKFEDQLKALQTKMSGVHRADIGRMSVAAAAFSLGISNMRRRRARTVLTCITLVLLTFTVLSFTSVTSGMRFNVRRQVGDPRYNGLMIRNAIWEPLQEGAQRVLYDEFGRRRVVVARAWLDYTKQFGGEQSFVALTAPKKSEKIYNARAIVGLDPREPKVTGIDWALRRTEEGGRQVVWGRWFRPGEGDAVIISRAMAEMQHITAEDVNNERVSINISGAPFTLIGVIDPQRFSKIRDLDHEELTPVDRIQMAKQQQAAGGGTGAGEAEAGFQEYIHLTSDDVVIVPYETAINMGALVQSVAIDFVTPAEVRRVLNLLIRRLGFNVYAGDMEEKRIWRWSSIGVTRIGGFSELLIPILIAALIVLNTMLGSVYERVREIGIFSSIGLAPSHIATLFLAEAFVYSILGAIFGYLLGQGITKIIVYYDLLPGLNLNYASLSAVASTGLVIAVVMLSTVYPARKASEVATPAIERRWTVPEPVGDRWEIPLPFSVTGEQAIALNAFMSEWFNAYEEYSIGDFVTQDVSREEFESQYGTGYRIALMAWLAPFDLGVSQRVTLETIPAEMTDVFELKLTLDRESGDVSSWKRVNRRFLNTLRKQFLIWRTLRTEDRDQYLGREPAAEDAGG